MRYMEYRLDYRAVLEDGTVILKEWETGTVHIYDNSLKELRLFKAGIEKASAVFVTIPDDMIAMDIVRACHDMNPDCSILCRVRYNLNIKLLQLAGADMVVCEETTVCNALLKLVSGYN